MSTLTELIKESLEGKLSEQIRASLASEDGEMNEGFSKYLDLKEYHSHTFDVSSSDMPDTFIKCVKKFLGTQKLLAFSIQPAYDDVCARYVNSHGSTIYVPLSSIEKPVKRVNDGKRRIFIYKWEDEYFAKYYDEDDYLTYIFA